MEQPENQLTLKWLGLAAAIWVQAFAGNAYTFPNYSPRLKSVLGYSQIQLNNLGVAKDIGENVGLITGYLSNKLPAWAILLIGGVEAFLGYGVLWLVISERIFLPYWLICVALCVGANSAAYFNTAVLVTIMRNFPQSRGTVAGILKGFVGLSGAIFTQIFTSFLFKDPVSLVLLLSLSPLFVSLVCMNFIRPVPGASQDPEEKRNFLLVHVICVSIAIYLLITSLAQEFIPVKSAVFNIVVASIMLLFLVAPVCVALKFFILGLFKKDERAEYPAAVTKYPAQQQEQQQQQQQQQLQQPLLHEHRTVQFQIGSNEDERPQADEETGVRISYQSEGEDKGRPLSVSGSATSLSDVELEEDPELLMAVGEGAVQRKRRPRRGEDFNTRQALIKADFWLLFFTFFCGVGSGVTVINNMGQMGQAQGYSDVTIFITLIGIWNFLGRLAGGAITEKYVKLLAIPRTVFMAGAQLLMAVAHLSFAWGGQGSLHAGSIILGLCYGVHFSVMIPTASELFGLKHFGKIYNVLTIGDPVGSLLFSGFIAGYLYDREAGKEPGDSGCYGPHCFRLTFIIMAGVCVVGMLTSIYISVRIKRVYESLYRKKASTPSSVH